MQDDPVDLTPLAAADLEAREERVVQSVLSRMRSAPPGDLASVLSFLARPALTAAAIIAITALAILLRPAPRAPVNAARSMGDAVETLLPSGPLNAWVIRPEQLPSASEVVLSLKGQP